jgi:hypothetical protein
MIALTPHSWHDVRGRGKVAAFLGDSLPPGIDHPQRLLNRVVLLDGDPYMVTGTETFSYLGAIYRNPYSLVVRPATNQEELVHRLAQQVLTPTAVYEATCEILRDALAEARRLGVTAERRRKRCGCLWCCGDMPPGTTARGEGHHGCPAAREDA